MITISTQAGDKIRKLMEDEGKSGNFLRVGVVGGGCSGLSYDLKFVDSQDPDDHVFESNGITILVEKKSLLYLFGTELEFSDGLNGKGFNFKNPQASRTCGCGESFAV